MERIKKKLMEAAKKRADELKKREEKQLEEIKKRSKARTGSLDPEQKRAYDKLMKGK